MKAEKKRNLFTCLSRGEAEGRKANEGTGGGFYLALLHPFSLFFFLFCAAFRVKRNKTDVFGFT
jgi:hypothetical protein